MSSSPDLDVGEPDAFARLPRQVVRLRKRAEFVEAAKGRRAHGRNVTIQIRRRPEADGAESRFGLTVTRKVGNAVERNRIKRRLRAALQAPILVPQVCHDYVILARRDALTAPFPALVAEIARLIDPSQKPAGRGGRTSPASRPAPRLS